MDWQQTDLSEIGWNYGDEGYEKTSGNYKFFRVLLSLVFGGHDFLAGVFLELSTSSNREGAPLLRRCN